MANEEDTFKENMSHLADTVMETLWKEIPTRRIEVRNVHGLGQHQAAKTMYNRNLCENKNFFKETLLLTIIQGRANFCNNFSLLTAFVFPKCEVILD